MLYEQAPNVIIPPASLSLCVAAIAPQVGLLCGKVSRCFKQKKTEKTYNSVKQELDNIEECNILKDCRSTPQHVSRVMEIQLANMGEGVQKDVAKCGVRPEEDQHWQDRKRVRLTYSSFQEEWGVFGLPPLA